MDKSKMGLGSAKAASIGKKMPTNPTKHAKVANVTARPAGMGTHKRGDALSGVGGHSPVKAKGCMK